MSTGAPKKQKGIEIKNLDEFSFKDLSKEQMKAITGGEVLSCGMRMDQCRALKVLLPKSDTFPQELQVIDLSAKARRAIS